MADAPTVPSCVLKVNFHCCPACPKKVKKMLQKINGVDAVDIDTENGLVTVHGTVQLSTLIQTISEKMGKKAELYAYEKNPETNNEKLDTENTCSACKYEEKNQTCSFADKSNDGKAKDPVPQGPEKSSVEPRMFGSFGRTRPGCYAWLPPPPLPPAFRLPSYRCGQYRPVYPYSPPYRITQPPRPYPYDFYEDTEPPIGNSVFHTFRDDNLHFPLRLSHSAKSSIANFFLPKLQNPRLCLPENLSSYLKNSGATSDGLRPRSSKGQNLKGTKITPCIESNVTMSGSIMDEMHNGKAQKAVAMDCEMVGGGSDGSIDLCARVCLVDEDENIILHTYVQPQIPVTNYRYEVTGLTEDHLRDAIPLNEVQDKIMKILYNGESVGRIPPDGGKARLLAGHDVQHDLDCLRIKYPGFLLRDTAKYRPLMKTNLVSHSLKHLTKTYLGQHHGVLFYRYNIQCGIHDPYEDCISVMRLYKRMRGQDHQQVFRLGDEKANSGFDSFRSMELEKKAPDELYEISTSDYKCWCLDLTKDCNPGS
ncbi:hypothetical protein CXB51_027662 [Gossypium anomalum]|uniref:RNA exonuclease 4 n=1 Tax=Gossypium anomalum TaxID=47600 RepID=A0A8J5XZ36_9ROSI|nr:hypothetical protein CXB51_027662 [Gossypium anomalum]